MNSLAYITARWILSALGILLAAYLVPGVSVAGFYTALILALFLGFVNATLRPLLILITLPVNIATLGLFTIFINGLLFWLLSTIIKGFELSGFLAAILGAFVISIFSWLGSNLLKDSHGT